MTNLLQDKVIFLTGGGQGIGRECALAYAQRGRARRHRRHRPRQRPRRSPRYWTAAGWPVECDVGDNASVEQAVRATLDRFGRLDAVHNNAGIANPSLPLHETSEEEWDALHRVNLKSVYLTTRHAYRRAQGAKGCILNTASMVGLIGQGNHAAYVSTKGAMIALTKAMALDYAADGMRVNAICPAGVWTPLLRQWAAEQPNTHEIEEWLDEVHALGYCPEGDVIADAAVFLLSDKARFITGVALPVSGGAELGYRS